MAEGWDWLDKLGSNVGQVAGAFLEAELIKRSGGSSVPAVASVPNSTAARDTSSAAKPDPNAAQRYVLWGGIAVGVVILAVIAMKLARR